MVERDGNFAFALALLIAADAGGKAGWRMGGWRQCPVLRVGGGRWWPGWPQLHTSLTEGCAAMQLLQQAGRGSEPSGVLPVSKVGNER
jgi:hypothetical protein